jgi:hypothetical protein
MPEKTSQVNRFRVDFVWRCASRHVNLPRHEMMPGDSYAPGTGEMLPTTKRRLGCRLFFVLFWEWEPRMLHAPPAWGSWSQSLHELKPIRPHKEAQVRVTGHILKADKASISLR